MFTLSELKKRGSVKVERIFTGKYAKEDIKEYKEEAIEAFKSLFGSSFDPSLVRESPMGIGYQDRFFMSPKIYRKVNGEVVFRSNDYYFQFIDPHSGEVKKSFGEINKSCLREYGWEIECVGGTIQYHIKE